LQRLAERQHEFASALLDGARPSPPGLVGHDGIPSPRRFAVYRNNVAAGLIGTLKDNYPAVHRIVGDEFFRAMAALFATAHPPSSPIMLDYGAGLADFIEAFEPASSLPYLADVARIERAWIEAYHAPDAASLTAEAFRSVGQERLADIRLTLHPSLRLTQSNYPALSIWRMNVDGGTPGPIDLNSGEDAMIIRPEAEVVVHQLPPGAAAFIKILDEGKTPATAAIAALEATPHADLEGFIRGLITSGAFTAFDLAETGRALAWSA
jgi:hypothetical protein